MICYSMCNTFHRESEIMILDIYFDLTTMISTNFLTKKGEIWIWS